MVNDSAITRGLLVSVAGVLLAVALGAFLGLSRSVASAGMSEPTVAPENAPASIAPSIRSPDVRLVIDFQDGTQAVYPRVSLLEIKGERTVLDVLELAKKLNSPRALTFDASGSGDMTLITSLAGVKNQGGGSEARNWQFWVNDEFAKRGVAATVVNPGDRVTWAFMPWNPDGPGKRPD